ncbi:fimbria/pilus periplasmic chaperone [Herbaspirillum sp. LeCh32-8]|uniref:fimbrial biogenesis chaperone n=1 Tax=Herbaspirillum sp. LeCh32-8 TaxID=2821356 RepID=UPI001AE33BE9|nr:fimbria/pilus periplasmic chaperone [Herbaspirillum sp. LeCh32-8]MBP0597936.1 fimbria/pilus periplasmic chaperone [Herbaspirillum sp. LeCh32-8]
MKKKMFWIAAVCALVASLSANASVVIVGTRLVFPSNEREITVRLSNEGKEPGLIQVWMDDGDEKSTPEQAHVPFVLTPPLFRVDAGKGQSVRMLYNGQPLPQDKETLFWFNMLEVGPKPTFDADQNYMQVAFRTRIKVFYRPKALNTQEQQDEAIESLRWTLKRADDGGYSLVFNNPSPYFITVIKAGLIGADDKPLAEVDQAAMADPGKAATISLKDLRSAPSGKFKVRFTYLNDFGGTVVKDVELADAAKQ